jgi:ubiquinone/menaquinone biosynthesis C-methylase UbiE
LDQFAQLLVPALDGKSDVRILDLASASGEPAATLASALPKAQVLSTDIAAPYLQLGQARARCLGLANLQFETADAENLQQYGDASFDAVTIALGIMFLPEHDKALSEIARVLKPGGTLLLTVWGPHDRVPFFETARKLATGGLEQQAVFACSPPPVQGWHVCLH